MRKLLLPFIFLSCTVANAQIRNGGFEDLNSSDMPAFWQGNLVLLPVWFDSTGVSHTDSVVFDEGAFYVVNNTDVHSGDHAIELRNAFDYTTNTPFIGTWSAAPDSDAYNGFPLVQVPSNGAPASIGFYAKYMPVNGDSAWVSAVVSDGASNPVGSGSMYITGIYADYAAFELPITYTSSEPAALLQLSFANARPGGRSTVGTRLLIDDVAITSVMGVEEHAALPEVALFPNPAHGSVMLRTPATVTDLRAVDLTGREQRLQRATDGTVDLAGLSEGVYVLRIATPQGEVRRSLVVR